MKRRIGILLLVVMMTQTVFGVDAIFHADSLHGSLGDIISFGWTLDHDTNIPLHFAEIELDGTGIEILDQKITKTSTGSDIDFSTAIYDSVGIYHFPSVMAYLGEPDAQDSLILRGPDIEIRSILTASDTTFRDIKGLHSVKLPFDLSILVWVLGVLLIVWLGYLIFKRFSIKDRATKPEKIIVPPEMAHVIALRDLEHLKRSKYLRFEQYKEFYSELTHILKTYYENRYLIDALELTTSEFMDKIGGMAEFNAEQLATTRQILETADFIKFAKGSSNELESGEALNRIILLVKETMIKEDQGEQS